MNPDDIVQIGPLAIALDRLVAVVLILVFLMGGDLLARRFASGHQKARAGHAVAIALVAGLAGARAAYIWIHADSFALDPAAAIYVWMGGWSWIAGVLAAGAALIIMLRKTRPLAPVLGLLAALAAAWAIFAGGQAARPIQLPADLAMTMAHGPATTAGELRGKPLVLNLWASWCLPCRREMPMLVDAAADENRARILLVNQGEGPEKVRDFLRAQDLSGRDVALDPQGVLGTLAASQALPTTLFVAADGELRQIHIGEISRVQLDIGIRAAAEARQSGSGASQFR